MARLVQLDVMDGIFVPETSLNELRQTETVKDIFFEIHLMVNNPLEKIISWGKLENVETIIFHLESVKENEFRSCLKAIKKAKKKAGVALNPETDLEKIKKWLPELDLVLLMTVNPGRAGQNFQEEVIPKIKNLRELWPNGRIEVDGGINLDSAKRAVDAGANLLAVGSFVFENPQPDLQIKKLNDYFLN